VQSVPQSRSPLPSALGGLHAEEQYRNRKRRNGKGENGKPKTAPPKKAKKAKKGQKKETKFQNNP